MDAQREGCTGYLDLLRHHPEAEPRVAAKASV